MLDAINTVRKNPVNDWKPTIHHPVVLVTKAIKFLAKKKLINRTQIVFTNFFIFLPELQCTQPHERQNHRDDPEADDDGGFGPAFFLEMVMNGSHGEDPFSGEFERSDLNYDG